jgi:hypothetical protein
MSSEAEVKARVAVLPNLNDAQRAIVSEIAVASVLKNRGLEPNIEGIASFVRSQATHIGNDKRPFPTDNTLVANNGKI